MEQSEVKETNVHRPPNILFYIKASEVIVKTFNPLMSSFCERDLGKTSHHMTKPTKWRAPSEDSDQPEYLPSLISLCCPHEETLGP